MKAISRVGISRVGISRVGIIAAYLLVFWLALPLSLWRLSARIDSSLDWRASAWWPGWIVLAIGLLLFCSAMVQLWRRGRGLPISALPPPRLCREGVYGLVRHPIYLAFNLGLLGAGWACGSRAMVCVVAPAFLPCWLLYAAIEERGLLRRFGSRYRRYRREVGVLPRPDPYRIAQLAMWAGLFPTRVEGAENVPRAGGAILVANHACYIDPLLVGAATRRRVHFLATADAFRGKWGWLLRALRAVPVRRYRSDPVACLELLRLLEDGELVGIFAEGERTPLGDRQPVQADTAAIVARTPWPVIPVGVSGGYDVGPRWADRLRRRPTTIRVGQRLCWTSGDPARDLDVALAELIDADPQSVHLEGLDTTRIARVLWGCPRCGDCGTWDAANLSCDASGSGGKAAGCGARWTATKDGRFRDETGVVTTLATLGRALLRRPPGQRPLRARAVAAEEASLFGPPRPLCARGEGELVVGSDGLRFGELRLPLDEITSATTERADTLQVATRQTMWQFRPTESRGSPFRLQHVLDYWRAKGAR